MSEKTNEFKGIEIEFEDYLVQGNMSVMRISEWTNGEGFDVIIDDKYIQLTWTQSQMLMYMLNHPKLHNVKVL